MKDKDITEATAPKVLPTPQPAVNLLDMDNSNDNGDDWGDFTSATDTKKKEEPLFNTFQSSTIPTKTTPTAQPDLLGGFTNFNSAPIQPFAAQPLQFGNSIQSTNVFQNAQFGTQQPLSLQPAQFGAQNNVGLQPVQFSAQMSYGLQSSQFGVQNSLGFTQPPQYSAQQPLSSQNSMFSSQSPLGPQQSQFSAFSGYGQSSTGKQIGGFNQAVQPAYGVQQPNQMTPSLLTPSTVNTGAVDNKDLFSKLVSLEASSLGNTWKKPELTTGPSLNSLNSLNAFGAPGGQQQSSVASNGNKGLGGFD
ncbi:hypothetical protein HK096_001109, partial [Nowakowskiella sp. JEL0078]